MDDKKTRNASRSASRAERNDARALQKSTGVAYAEALRQVREKNAGLAAQMNAFADDRDCSLEDYHLLTVDREPGVPFLPWAAGVTPNGDLAWIDARSVPHVAISGPAGSGKSTCLGNMIRQIAASNGPGEVNLWCVDPGVSMREFRDLDVVTRFVDSWTPDREFFKNAADLLVEAVQEMDRRYAAFLARPDVDGLGVARQVALSATRQSGAPLSSHALHAPYLFIVVDSSNALFDRTGAGAPDDYDRMERAVTELARNGRAAGIRLVIAGQRSLHTAPPLAFRMLSQPIDFGALGVGRGIGQMGMFRGFVSPNGSTVAVDPSHTA